MVLPREVVGDYACGDRRPVHVDLDSRRLARAVVGKEDVLPLAIEGQRRRQRKP